MVNRHIKYIGYYDFQDSLINRNVPVASANKMDYIARTLSSIGYNVEIISMLGSAERRLRIHKGEKIYRFGYLLRLFPTFSGYNKIIRRIQIVWHLACMFFFLIFNVKKNDTVIVYHSLGYLDIINWIKRIKKFKLILEVEEIYTDVSAKSKYFRSLEYRIFNNADAYIFSTVLLDEKINIAKKPSCIIYGTYQVEPQIVEKFDDGKIHVVYAGTFDPRKGGATAAAAAEFLPENYHVHILGFGGEKDTQYIKDVIEQTNKKSKAIVSFEGLKKGREYIEFIQRCHIGLSTQNPNAAFNATSFPSKILSYMAHGLYVVSIRIKAIEESSVSDYLSYYKTQIPEEIANAIINVNLSNNNREIIEGLNKSFISGIGKLIDRID